MPDFKTLESDINKCTRFDAATGRLTGFDDLKMGTIIRAVRNIFMGDTDPAIEERLRKLDEAYEKSVRQEGSELPDKWRTAAYKCVFAARDAMERDSDRYVDFAHKYDQWIQITENEYGKNGQMKDFLGEFIDPSKATDAKPDLSLLDATIKQTEYYIINTGKYYVGDDTKLGAMVRALDTLFLKETDAGIARRLSELSGQYTPGTEMPQEWRDSTLQCIKDARQAMENDGQRYLNFDYGYRALVGDVRYPQNGNPVFDLGPDIQPAPVQKPQLTHNSIFEDINTVAELYNTSPQDAVDALAPILFLVEKNFPSSAGPELKAGLSALREEYESGYVSSSWVDSAIRNINGAANVMTVGYLETLNNDLVRGKANVLGERYSDIYDQYQEILPQAKLIGRELADYEKKQIQDVEGIRNVYARMVAENSRLHHDSKEYKDMMKAAQMVDDYARSRAYDPSDMQSAALMRQKMDVLFDTACRYSAAKVYGKTKSTTRGIERKNEALLLIEYSTKRKIENGKITQFEMLGENNVTDLRRSRKDKVKRSFTELMDEEKQATRREFGMTADRGARRPERKRLNEIARRNDPPQAVH